MPRARSSSMSCWNMVSAVATRVKASQGRDASAMSQKKTHHERDIVHGEERREGIEELAEGGPFPLSPEEAEVGSPERVRELEQRRILGKDGGRRWRGGGRGSQGASRHRRRRRPTFLEQLNPDSHEPC